MTPRRPARRRRWLRDDLMLAGLAVVVLGVVIGLVAVVFIADRSDVTSWEHACQRDGGKPQVVSHTYDYYKKSYVYNWICTLPDGTIRSRHTSYTD